MEQRMASMSPEERQRFEARMREGGGRGADPRGRTAAAAPAPAQTGGNTTIDALFAPIAISESRGRIWLYDQKQLRSVNVRTGISDGSWTEIIEGGESSELQPGAEVVINLVTGVEPQARPGQQGAGSNPLLPQRGNQRGGGPGGGGRGR
jgi:hypothetical protein